MNLKLDQITDLIRPIGWREVGQACARAHGVERRGETAVDLDVLRRIGKTITTPPEHMTLNSKLIRILKTRAANIEAGTNIDWATAEHLAFGSLLLEGDVVRLSGQDSVAALSASAMRFWLIRIPRNAMRR